MLLANLINSNTQWARRDSNSHHIRAKYVFSQLNYAAKIIKTSFFIVKKLITRLFLRLWLPKTLSPTRET
jgi:hypothetical protein